MLINVIIEEDEIPFCTVVPEINNNETIIPNTPIDITATLHFFWIIRIYSHIYYYYNNKNSNNY